MLNYSCAVNGKLVPKKVDPLDQSSMENSMENWSWDQIPWKTGPRGPEFHGKLVLGPKVHGKLVLGPKFHGKLVP